MPTRLEPARRTEDRADAGGRVAESVRVLVSGMFALSISVVAASLFSQLNTGRLLPVSVMVASCFLTVFIGACTWAALLEACGASPHGAGAVLFLGLALPLASWFLVHFNHEYWLLGPAAADVHVAEAGKHRYASSLRLRDARVATEFVGVKSIREGGGRGHQPRTEWYYVAPVVHEGWTPEQPVTLWAAAPVNHYYGSLENWSKPHRAGVQLSSHELRHLREAAASSEEQFGVRSLDGALFIRWTPEPEAEVERARKFVLWVMAGNSLLLLLLFAGASLAGRFRRGGPRGFRPAQKEVRR